MARCAELDTRQADGRWILNAAEGVQDSVEIASIGCTLTLAALYEKIDLPESDEP